MEYYQISIIVGIALIILEMVTLTFIFLGLGFGAFAVSITEFILGDFLIGRDSVVFALFSLISILIFRKLFKSKNDEKRLTEEDVNQY
ncbi:MAG: hypothetical protein F2735_07720 [Actinobacteria bacterium]|jgi:membrane protein implicated in regulation of membrane protease activity|nr:hypothetical protein [Actinomycetota bacterium]